VADSVTTLAIKTVLDGQQLTQGLQKQEQDVKRFADGVKGHAGTLRGAFANADAGKLFDNLKAGNFGALASDAKGVVSKIGESWAEAAGFPLRYATAAVSALAAVEAAARRESAQIVSHLRLGERIGSNLQDTGTILRAFSRAGIDDAEGLLDRMFLKVGELRRDLGGAQANLLRQIGLDPEQLVRESPAEGIQQIVGALSRLSNVYDRVSYSQAIFGKGFRDVQDLIRRGPEGIAFAADLERRFGPGEGTVAAARGADSNWRRVKDVGNEAWESIYSVSRAVLVRIDDQVSGYARKWVDRYETAKNVLALPFAGFPTSFDAQQSRQLFPALFEGLPPPPPRPRPGQPERSPQDVAAGQNAEQVLKPLRERVRLDETLIAQAERLRYVSEGASREDAERFRDLVQGREALQRKLIEDRASQEEQNRQLREFDQLAQKTVRGRNRDLAGAVFGNLRESIAQLTTARGEAERLGYVRANATQAEYAAVLPLLQARERLARLPAGGLLGLGFDAGARTLIALQTGNSAQDLAQEWRDAADAVGLTAGQLRSLRLAQLEAQAASLGWVGRLAQGWIDAARAQSFLLDQTERMHRDSQESEQIRLRTRTPLEQFNLETARQQKLRNLSSEAFDRDLASRFRQLTAGLGSGPSSFGLTGTSSTSREGLLRADDFARRSGEDSPQWAQQQLRALQELQRIQDRNTQRIVDALRDSGVGGLPP
jgi:hypothetical protein